MESQSLNVLNVLITFAAAIAGVAVGWGALKATQVNQGKRIKVLENWKGLFTGESNPGSEPAFVRRSECTLAHKGVKTRLEEGAKKMEEHGKALRGLQSFARYILTKDGMELDEINRIINGE